MISPVYLAALTAALRAEGLDVEEGAPGPWSCWCMTVRLGCVHDEVMVWADEGSVAHAEAVAAEVARLFRQKMVGVCN